MKLSDRTTNWPIPNAGKPWSADDHALMAELDAQRLPCAEIARQLGRTWNSIDTRRSYHKVNGRNGQRGKKPVAS